MDMCITLRLSVKAYLPHGTPFSDVKVGPQSGEVTTGKNLRFNAIACKQVDRTAIVSV